MYLALIAVAVGVLAGLASGGRIGPWHRPALRAIWLLPLGAACELAGYLWGLGFVIAGYVVLIAWSAANVRFPGLLLVTAGLLSNLVVITVDGGMPVRGAPPGVALSARHHGESPSDRLTGLADVVRVAPIGQTVSAGDLVLALGAATAAFSLARPARRRLQAPAP